MKPVRGKAIKAPKFPPAPEIVIRRALSNLGAQQAHIAIMAGNVTP